MNRLIKKLMVCICLVSFASIGFAVSDDEVDKITAAMPEKGAVRSKAPRKMLVFSLCKGFAHRSIPYWEEALRIMGEKTGAFETVHSEDMSVFSADNLRQYDAICFNNTTKLVPDAAQQKAIMDFIKGGKGIVGVHAATDNFPEWPEGNMMMGGVFTGHPWTSGGTWAVKLDDPKHKLMKAFGGKGFKINDEIYRTAPPQYSRDNQRVLMSLDMSDETTKNTEGVTSEDMDTGISWVKSVGKGRLFYCSLGHNNHLTWNTPVLEHYLAGIQFAMGDLKCDTTPLKSAAGKLSESNRIEDVLTEVAKYEDGQSRAALIELEAIVLKASDKKSARADVEKELGQMLEGDATMAAKDFFCRQLSLIGSGASAHLLGRLVIDEATSDIARYAAERIPGRKIDKMLIKAAGKTSGDVRIGIVNTLGARKSKAAVAAIAEMLNGSDEKLSLAVIEALKRIGNAKAMGVLAEKKDVLEGELHGAVMDAYLYCADGLLAAGKTKKAATAYRESYQSTESDPIRIAAVRGMINAAGKNKTGVILDVLKGDDKVAQAVAISAVRELEPSATESVLAQFESLSDANKVRLLTAIDQVKSKAALAMVCVATSSENPDVRLAAIETLALVGDANSARLLTKIAANSKGNDQKAARESLYNLAAEGADKAIVDSFAGADGGVKIELLKAMAARQIADSDSALLKGIQDGDAKVRIEAFKAICVTQNVELVRLLDALAKAATDPERSMVGKAIAIVVSAKDDAAKDVQQIVELMPSLETTSVDATASALRILGRIGNERGYDTLVEALSSSDEKIQRGAIDGLSQWPYGKAADVLKAVALDALTDTNEVMAFRGHVAQLSKINGPESIQLLAEAMEIAPNDAEKQTVLAALVKRPSIQSLEIAVASIEDPELKTEAATAVSRILDKLDGQLDKKAMPVLLKAKSQVADDAIAGKIQDLINNLDRFAGIVTKWQVSEPYVSKEDKLIDVAFAPEDPASAGVEWKAVTADKDGVVDLLQFARGSDRVAYLKVNIASDKARDVRLEMGSDDGIKVWVNGKVVHRNDVIRPCNPGQDKVNAHLQKGDNTILMKIVQVGGQWAASLRVRSTDGSEVDGIEV